MEKSNSRARRNGNGAETGAPTSQNPAGTGTSATGATRPGSPAPTPAQEAKQRIEMAAGSALLQGKSTPRGLQDTFIDERNDVLAVINELEDQLDRHQEIRETMERELTTTSEKLQAATQRVQELEWQAVTLQTRVDALEQLRTEVASLEEELADANTKAQRINDQLSETEKERSRLKTDLKAANKQLDELWAASKERDSLRSECKILSAKVEELERSVRENLEERTSLQSQLQETQISLDETTTERNRLQMANRAADDRIRELTQVQGTLDDTIENLRAEKKNLQVQLTHLERENARLIEQRQFYECEVTTLRNQNRSAESALNSVKKAFSEVRVALSETKSRARRRAVDSWPRVGSALHGIVAEATADGIVPTIPVAAMVEVTNPAETTAPDETVPAGIRETTDSTDPGENSGQ